MMRSQDSEVEGVEDDEIVEEVEVEDPESAKHESGGLSVVEVMFSSGKSLLNSVFSTSSFMLCLFSCML